MSRIRTLPLLLPMTIMSMACDLSVMDGIPSTKRDQPISNKPPSVLLYSTMDSAQDVFLPVIATTAYATLQEAIPGLAHVTFEPSQFAYAVRFDADGFAGDGPLRFHGDNFDFDDTDNDGGRLDFWIKFNVDPDSIYENTWVARSNYGPSRFINYEFASSSATLPAQLMIDVYSNILNNERTNYRKFRVSPRTSPIYQNIKKDEWHLITATWRRNGESHKAELHIYIDGSQEGCLECNDYNGNLPSGGSVTDLFFSPPLYGNVIHFSMDEIYSFDSWDVSAATGHFANLEIPEGVTLTYPMSADYPVYAEPVVESNVVFEFFVVNYASEQCECDLYVDGLVVGTVTTTTQAHTEITNPTSLTEGAHTFQVKCDNNRLVSAVTRFNVDLQ